MVAPPPGTRRPTSPYATPRPRPRPPAGRPPIGRPPPPFGYPPVRRQRSRRPLVLLVLLLVTVLAGGYLYVSRGSGGSSLSNDFVSVDQRVAAGARAIPVAAQKIQRFDEVHTFDVFALTTLTRMRQDRDLLRRIVKTQTGPSRQIAQRAANAAANAVDAGLQYRNSVAVTYNLSNADDAKAMMLNAASTLDESAQAWNKR